MDHLTDLQAGTAHTTHHLILDQILGTIAGTHAKMLRTDRILTETTTDTESTSKMLGMTREIMIFKIGMTTTEIGLTTRGGQTNTNTTETNPEHR